jgi:hypothetical protein
MRRVIVLVAFIGLVGTIAASGLATELFKRRDLRESIRADLEVYEKLPDSPVKDKLLGDIHYRVGDLVDEPPKNSGVWESLPAQLCRTCVCGPFSLPAAIPSSNGATTAYSAFTASPD